MSKPVVDLRHQQFVSAMRGRQRYYRLKGVSVDLRPLFKTVFGPIEGRERKSRGPRRTPGQTIHKIYADPRPEYHTANYTKKYVKFHGEAAPVLHIYSSRTAAEKGAGNWRKWSKRTYKAVPDELIPGLTTHMRLVRTREGWAVIQTRPKGTPYRTRAGWLDTGKM